MSICFGGFRFASSRFGIEISKTPSLCFALIFSAFTASGYANMALKDVITHNNHTRATIIFVQ